ncbi:ABC transporter permease [Yeosuana sp.]|uniref:ABC transporter permease n=1 Tax=Yeosuana sp. TaxID=2529388 RepID=UPI004054BD65
MFDIERWQEIFETLRKNKLQTLLTGLSVASGIFILVILLGFSSGIQNGVKAQFEKDATNQINIWTRRTTKEYKGLNPGRRIQLKNQDFNKISNEYAEFLEYKSANYMIWRTLVNYGKESNNYRVWGSLPDYQFIENSDIGEGRFINESDLDNSSKVAVIGNKIKLDLFKDEDPIGKYISIFGINFKIIGLYYDPGGEDSESQIYIPLTTAQKSFNGADRINNISYTVKMPKNFDQGVELSQNIALAIESDLKQMHTVAPNDLGAIRVNNNLEEAQKYYSLIDAIKLIFWFVGIGTIIAGVVGVGNIMLIIVKERTKEIGIRKALGAQPLSIVGMIMQEAIFVTMFSGMFGLILGLALLEVVGPLIKNDYIKYPQVDFNTALTTVFILVLAGAFAGFFPAYRAAKIKPIIALRDE